MKTSKLFTIDIEIAEKLRGEINASALINMLLMHHYKDCKSEDEIIKAVKAKIKAKKHQKRVKNMIKKQLNSEKEA